MTVDEFDKAIAAASQDVDFGPIDGFGGRSSDQVIRNLPVSIVELIRVKWGYLELSFRGSGKPIRDYAEMIGHNVESDLAAISS